MSCRSSVACRFVRKSPGTPSEVVAEDLAVVHGGDLDNGNWALAALKSTPGGTAAGRARHIHEFFVVFRKLARTLKWKSRKMF